MNQYQQKNFLYIFFTAAIAFIALDSNKGVVEATARKIDSENFYYYALYLEKIINEKNLSAQEIEINFGNEIINVQFKRYLEIYFPSLTDYLCEKSDCKHILHLSVNFSRKSDNY